MLVDSLADGNVKLSQAHLIVVSDAQRVVPMVTPHPVLRMMSEYYNKTSHPPHVLAAFTCSPDRWPSIDSKYLETPLHARTFFLATKTIDSWFGPTELVVEYAPHPPEYADSPLSRDLRKIDPEGKLLRLPHYRRANRVSKQLGSFAA